MARTTQQTQFVTIRSEGGMLSPDLLARVVAMDAHLGGLLPTDYGLEKGDRLGDAASRAWTRCKAYWAAFKASQEGLSAGDSGITETREQWMLPLFRELSYGRLTYRASAEIVDNRAFFLSHRAGEGDDAPPVHIVAAGQGLDEGRHIGTTGLRVSPHGLVQDYLNRTPHLWGIVTNGLRLRLLRDNASLTRPAYVEFDLESMMEGGIFADFLVLYLLLHRSRLPRGTGDADQCWLETWRSAAVQGGTRALDSLRLGVTAALAALGRGFVVHRANTEVQSRLSSGELSVEAYYRQLLRLVYRCLFLLVAEERGLLFAPDATARGREIYAQHYALSRLRDVAGRRHRPDPHDDIWRSLRVTFGLMLEGSLELELAALAGGLFDGASCPDLDKALIANGDLLEALRGLSLVTVRGATRRVNYRDLGVEELGSVYESLLDLHPRLNKDGVRLSFDLIAGSERKTTGSYYTPPALVGELIKSALEPVIAAALKKGRTPQEKIQALLRLRVCDPAVGSGHFLLAAARRIGHEYARLTAGETEPDLERLREGVREAIRHCIYGVDLNPLAVDLCKLALWLEGHTPGRPLSFLDHRIKIGNSLVGATPEAVENGIPTEAFEPVSGDEKAVAATIKKHNKIQLGAKLKLGDEVERFSMDPLSFGEGILLRARATDDEVLEALEIGELPEEDAQAVRAKEQRYRAFNDLTLAEKRMIANVWTAAFFWPLTRESPQPPTQAHLRGLRRGARVLTGEQVAQIEVLARTDHFFHWSLEFPEALDAGGFDCVLGNPPWERIKLQEEEFFSARSPDIAKAPNAAVRKKLITQLSHTDPALGAAFLSAKRDAEAQSKFVRESGHFGLTAVGDVNTYALFAEKFRNLLSEHGRAGIICPISIVTDDSTKAFFADLAKSKSLVSLVGFENEAFIFESIHHSYKFCLLTMAGHGDDIQESAFCFFCRFLEQIREPHRIFTLSREDIALFNPNTHTCPIFRTRADAELTRSIYRRVPVLLNETRDQNTWTIQLTTMFHMSNDSGLFRDAPSVDLVSLYEAKLLHQFDHRWASYERTDVRVVTEFEKRDPCFSVTPRYWIPREEVESRIGAARFQKWGIGFRSITSAVLERTAIFTILPGLGAGNSIALIGNWEHDAILAAVFLGCANSLIFDMLTRQKVGGNNFNFFIVKQLPVLPPSAYSPADIAYIAPRVLELVYTAWDMEPFAKDMGYDGLPFPWDEDRRALLRAELDAYYARLYGLTRKQLRYILDPHDLTDRELADILDPTEDLPDAPRTKDFPGETFRVLKEREIRQYGEYKTRRLVLEAWERLTSNQDSVFSAAVNSLATRS